MARRGENIYKRKDGRYEGRYIKGYDINEKAIYGYIYSRNYADIKEQLARCKSDKKAKSVGSDTLLSSWLIIWIEAETSIKETTKLLYKRHINNHIIPKIGKIPQRNPKQIQASQVNRCRISRQNHPPPQASGNRKIILKTVLY